MLALCGQGCFDPVNPVETAKQPLCEANVSTGQLDKYLKGSTRPILVQNFDVERWQISP